MKTIKVEKAVNNMLISISKSINAMESEIDEMSKRILTSREKMWELIYSKYPECKKDEEVVYEPKTGTIISFSNPNDKIIHHIQQIKAIAVKDKNFELASSIRDIELQYLKK